MPLSELVKKWTGMNFDIAAEEMRRLDGEPTKEEKLKLYGLYKQAVHGDIPSEEEYPKPKSEDEWATEKYKSWESLKGKSPERCKQKYLRLAEKMIQKYGRKIERTKWNSEVWSVDY